jgi:hypothetical protein
MSDIWIFIIFISGVLTGLVTGMWYEENKKC